MKKPKNVISEKNLSSLDGVKEVSFGKATPERRARGDFSKEGIPNVESHTFDDVSERRKRFGLDI